MTTRFQAVLFDLDGTLADTLADLANATNAALAELGCPTHPVAAYRHMVGDGTRQLCLRALPAERQNLLDQTLKLMRQHYDAHCFDLTRLYNGIPELIQTLREQQRWLAVLSNKPDEFTKRMIAHYFPQGSFQAVRGQRAGVPLKPDPAAAREIAQQARIAPERWLYLGDTNTDMHTATAAQMYAVGVLWGFRDRQELLESGARQIISRPSELLELGV